MYHQLLLLLSGDISLNPEPFQNHLQLDHDEWDIFKYRRLHFLPFNINSLLPRIHELRYVEKIINTVMNGISERKLGSSVLTSEIKINDYDLL